MTSTDKKTTANKYIYLFSHHKLNRLDANAGNLNQQAKNL